MNSIQSTSSYTNTSTTLSSPIKEETIYCVPPFFQSKPPKPKLSFCDRISSIASGLLQKLNFFSYETNSEQPQDLFSKIPAPWLSQITSYLNPTDIQQALIASKGMRTSLYQHPGKTALIERAILHDPQYREKLSAIFTSVEYKIERLSETAARQIKKMLASYAVLEFSPGTLSDEMLSRVLSLCQNTTSLNIPNHPTITPKGLIEALHSKITTLDISGNPQFNDPSFFEALALKCPDLQLLAINSLSSAEHPIDAALSCVSKYSHLEQLLMRDNFFNNLQESLDFLKPNSLKALIIPYIQSRDHMSDTALCEVLLHIAKQQTHLEYLGTSIRLLAKNIAAFPSLQKVSCDAIIFDSSQLTIRSAFFRAGPEIPNYEELVASLPLLEELSVAGYPDLSQLKKLKHLKVLNLSHRYNSYNTIEKISPHESLEVLDISDGIANISAYYVAEHYRSFFASLKEENFPRLKKVIIPSSYENIAHLVQKFVAINKQIRLFPAGSDAPIEPIPRPFVTALTDGFHFLFSD